MVSPGPSSKRSSQAKQRASTQSSFFGEASKSQSITPRANSITSSAALLNQLPSTKSEHFRSKSSSSTGNKQLPNDAFGVSMTNPYRFEGGRRYLRDTTLPYPLPVDLSEVHRQSLRLLLLMRLHGAPFCNTVINEDSPPKKVLEVACGSALWSSACHDYFKSCDHHGIEFTGLDIAPLAPDLRQSGVNWRFVQHDLRKRPWPFTEKEFDFIFLKDVGFCMAGAEMKDSPLAEISRLLKPGGVVEIWESDHVFRTLLPSPSKPAGATEDEFEQAEASAAYIMTDGTGFAVSQNKYLRDYNMWVEQALDKRNLSATPCATTMWALRVEAERFGNVGSRRLALPMGEVRWEKEVGRAPLTPYQSGLRRTALLTVVKFIESMEPVLKGESGKRQDEWDRWWASMISDLLEQNGTYDGECIEVGAWWAQRS